MRKRIFLCVSIVLCLLVSAVGMAQTGSFRATLTVTPERVEEGEQAASNPLRISFCRKSGAYAFDLAFPDGKSEAYARAELDSKGLSLSSSLFGQIYAYPRQAIVKWLEESQAPFTLKDIMLFRPEKQTDAYKMQRDYFHALNDVLVNATRTPDDAPASFTIWGRTEHNADAHGVFKTATLPFAGNEALLFKTEPKEETFYLEGKYYFVAASEATNNEDIHYYDYQTVSLDAQGETVEKQACEYYYYAAKDGGAHNFVEHTDEETNSSYFAEYGDYRNLGQATMGQGTNMRFEYICEPYEDETIKGEMQRLTFTDADTQNAVYLYDVLDESGIKHNMEIVFEFNPELFAMGGAGGMLPLSEETRKPILDMAYEGIIDTAAPEGVYRESGTLWFGDGYQDFMAMDIAWESAPLPDGEWPETGEGDVVDLSAPLKAGDETIGIANLISLITRLSTAFVP